MRAHDIDSAIRPVERDAHLRVRAEILRQDVCNATLKQPGRTADPNHPPLRPRRSGLDPHWATKSFADAQRAGRLAPLASGFPEDEDALQIDADARVLGATLAAGQQVAYNLQSTRYGYLVPARGRVLVNNQHVGERDGIAILRETRVVITALEAAEIILVDAA
jgi:quercetin 2,3-dioxygenase